MKFALKLVLIIILHNYSFSMTTPSFFNSSLPDSITNVKKLKNIMTKNPTQSKLLLNEYYTNTGPYKKNRPLPQREYYQSFKFSSGYSFSNTRSNDILKSYQDTSKNIFTFNQKTPIITFTHDIARSNIFSFSYTIGYQRSNIELNRRRFSSNKILAFINPRLTIFRTNRLESYFQLKIGLIYDDKKINDIKSITVRYLLSPNLKVYTGFTPLGVSFKIAQGISINAEWSLWSYESFNLGIKYNFNKRN